MVAKSYLSRRGIDGEPSGSARKASCLANELLGGTVLLIRAAAERQWDRSARNETTATRQVELPHLLLPCAQQRDDALIERSGVVVIAPPENSPVAVDVEYTGDLNVE